MPKRKRDGASVSPPGSPQPSSDRALHRRKKLYTQRIAAAQKPLVAALRIAAGLERQKFSRRKKTSQQKKDTKAVARLDAEYAILKTLDMNKLAERHLRKVIGKVKSLGESDVLPESAKVIEKGEQDPALLNVQARLYKVDAVRKVVDETIDDLKIIVAGATSAKEIANGDKRQEVPSKLKKAKRDEITEDIEGEDSDMFAAFDARIAAPSSGEDDSEDSLSDGRRPPSVEGSEREGDYDLDGASESESEQTDLSSAHLHDGRASTLQFRLSDSSQGESESDSDVVSIPIPKAKSKVREVQEVRTTAESRFLPALSQAAYYSGTDSEASDLDEKLAPRKNRRGQRARQKIWEQKFGEKAQHVQKQEQERSKGWDAKRGAVDDRKRGWGDAAAPGGRGPVRSGENAMPLGPKKTKRDDAGSLHPSWLAAKAAKEKKVDAKPQGKKVVFD
jgi:hypothetical protein